MRIQLRLNNSDFFCSILSFLGFCMKINGVKMRESSKISKNVIVLSHLTTMSSPDDSYLFGPSPVRMHQIVLMKIFGLARRPWARPVNSIAQTLIGRLTRVLSLDFCLLTSLLVRLSSLGELALWSPLCTRRTSLNLSSLPCAFFHGIWAFNLIYCILFYILTHMLNTPSQMDINWLSMQTLINRWSKSYNRIEKYQVYMHKISHDWHLSISIFLLTTYTTYVLEYLYTSYINTQIKQQMGENMLKYVSSVQY